MTTSDPGKWNIAFSRFTNFVQNLPIMLDEGDVEQYHYVINMFEDALDTDLSRFKVGDDRIKRPIQNPIPCWQTRLPAQARRNLGGSNVAAEQIIIDA